MGYIHYCIKVDYLANKHTITYNLYLAQASDLQISATLMFDIEPSLWNASICVLERLLQL
jgi:hypothetical protein